MPLPAELGRGAPPPPTSARPLLPRLPLPGHSPAAGQEARRASQPSKMDDTTDEQQLYTELKSAVWVVLDIRADGIGTGTGFCIDPNGLIMTCSHVVKGNICYLARQGDTEFRRATLLHRIESWDIAIFYFEEDLRQPGLRTYQFVSLAIDGTLIPGQDVYAIQHQNRLFYSFASGKISYPCSGEVVNPFDMCSGSSKQARDTLSITSKYRTAKEVDEAELHDNLPLVEMRNIHLDSGGSGGPVFILTREVVGMVSFSHRSTCYAVHVSALQLALQQAKEEYTRQISSSGAKLVEKVQSTAEVVEADRSEEN